MKYAPLVAAGAAALVASAMPAFGADSGTVSATVTAESTCITVTPETTDLGTLPFSTPSQTTSGLIGPTITSCTTASQDLLARATDATGTDANGVSMTWFLRSHDPCEGTQDRYRISTTGFSGGGTPVALGYSDQQIASLGANQTSSGTLYVGMPCTGSSGAGLLMSFSIVFTATL